MTLRLWGCSRPSWAIMLLCHAVAQVLLLWIAAEVRERQHGELTERVEPASPGARRRRRPPTSSKAAAVATAASKAKAIQRRRERRRAAAAPPRHGLRVRVLLQLCSSTFRSSCAGSAGGSCAGSAGSAGRGHRESRYQVLRRLRLVADNRRQRLRDRLAAKARRPVTIS